MSEPTPNTNREPAPVPSPGRNGPLSLRDRVKSLRLPDRPPQRRSPWGLVPWALCLVLLSSTIVLAVRQPPASKDTDDSKKSAENALAGMLPPGIQPGDVMLESKGYIVPIHRIQVSPKVGGMVTKLLFEEGMLIKQGAILAELEDVDYRADRDRAKGMAEVSRQRWIELDLSLQFMTVQAQADLDDATAQYDNENVQLQSEIDSRDGTARVDVKKRQATVAAKAARVTWHKNQVAMIQKGSLAARVAAAKGELQQNEADLGKAQWKLNNCVVRAPVTGIVLTKSAEEGSLVNPSAFSNGLSASLCDMADLAELEVDLSIPERDVGRLVAFKQQHPDPKKGQRCNVRADAFPDKVHEGYVSRIMPLADRAKGAVPVRVKIIIPRQEAGVYLRPDMGASVTFLNLEMDIPQPEVAAADARQKQ